MVTVKKFSAVWCGPCRALAPVMNEIKGQFSNVKFEEYDIDEYSEVTEQYGVRSVPTVIIEKYKTSIISISKNIGKIY